MQKSFFRAKQPGQCRAQKKNRSQAVPGPFWHKKKSPAQAMPGQRRAQKKSPAQAMRLTSAGIKKRSPSQTCVCDGLPKNGGDLLSQLVGQYHRRG